MPHKKLFYNFCKLEITFNNYDLVITILKSRVLFQHPKVIIFLLQKGADPNICNKEAISAINLKMPSHIHKIFDQFYTIDIKEPEFD